MSEKKGNPIVLVSGIVGVLLIGAGWRMMSAADLEKRANAIGWDAEIGLISQGGFAENIENSEKLHPRVKQLEKNAAEVGWVYRFGAPPYDENRLAELEKEVQEAADLYPRVIKLQERAKKITLDLPIVDKEKNLVRDGSAIQGFPYTDASLKKTAEYVGEMERLHQSALEVKEATRIDVFKDISLSDPVMKERVEKAEKLQKTGVDFNRVNFSAVSDIDYWIALQEMLSPVKISAGSFIMGCDYNEKTCPEHDDGPAHKVTITRDFYMMKTEVTQNFYESVTGKNPTECYSFAGYSCDNFRNPDFPVTHVTWFEALEFANRVSEQQGLPVCYRIVERPGYRPDQRYVLEWRHELDCKGWRLPTEAEWVYAFQGGKRQKFSGSDDCEEVANANCKKIKRPKDKIGLAKVCSKKANGYGLCDMSGNISEWCWDIRRENYFSKAPSVDPLGPEDGNGRLLKGGGWDDYPYVVGGFYRGNTGENIGLRLVRTAE